MGAKVHKEAICMGAAMAAEARAAAGQQPLPEAARSAGGKRSREVFAPHRGQRLANGEAQV